MNFKKLLQKLLLPITPLIIILILFCAAALTFVFVKELEQSPVAYLVYILSFYTLTVFCIFCAAVLPQKYKLLKQKLRNNPVTNRYLTDAAFRTHVSLYASLGINLLYAASNVIFFLLYRSMWFTVLAVYYGILAIMRFLLVRYVRKVGIGKDRLGELKRTMLCSLILLTVNFALSGAVLMILYQNKGFEYHGLLIYVMAMYTFFVTTHAIVNLVRYRKYNSPVMMITKVISLSAALVSMLSLETAMLSQFGGEMSLQDKRILIAATGASVSALVITMSVYMTARAAKEIKILKITRKGI